MGLLINLLTVVLVFDCVVLIFLVMMQLPKKDAGVGMAFGGGSKGLAIDGGRETQLGIVAAKSPSALLWRKIGVR